MPCCENTRQTPGPEEITPMMSHLCHQGIFHLKPRDKKLRAKTVLSLCPLKWNFPWLSGNTEVTSQSRTLKDYLYTVGLVLLTKGSQYLPLHCLQPRLGYGIYQQQYFTGLCNYCSNTLLFWNPLLQRGESAATPEGVLKCLKNRSNLEIKWNDFTF